MPGPNTARANDAIARMLAERLSNGMSGIVANVPYGPLAVAEQLDQFITELYALQSELIAMDALIQRFVATPESNCGNPECPVHGHLNNGQ